LYIVRKMQKIKREKLAVQNGLGKHKISLEEEVKQEA